MKKPENSIKYICDTHPDCKYGAEKCTSAIDVTTFGDAQNEHHFVKGIYECDYEKNN